MIILKVVTVILKLEVHSQRKRKCNLYFFVQFKLRNLIKKCPLHMYLHKMYANKGSIIIVN